MMSLSEKLTPTSRRKTKGSFHSSSPEVDSMISLMEEIISERNGSNTSWSMSDFELGTVVGSGTFGQVFLAREQRTKFMVALKVINKKQAIEEKKKTHLMREINIHKNLNHAYIISLFSYFCDASRVVLVLEFAGGGSVEEAIRVGGGRILEPRVAKFISQTAQALDYLHNTCSVIHRDVKPENVLLDHEDNVKLSDFGWSLRLSSSPVSTICGTEEYFSPEMVEKKNYTIKVDVWSLGVLCFECLVGVSPFQSDNLIQMYNKILDARVVFPESVPDLARDLIVRLLRYSPSRRLSLSKVMIHPWILEHYNLPASQR